MSRVSDYYTQYEDDNYELCSAEYWDEVFNGR